jgi:hypothetical protein
MAADTILEFMRKHNLPHDRATYLDIAYFGQVPDEISPEDEAEIPAEFRRGAPGDWEEF